jgi:Zn-dependent metalloprotease
MIVLLGSGYAVHSQSGLDASQSGWQLNRWIDVSNEKHTVNELEQRGFAPWVNTPLTDEWRAAKEHSFGNGYRDLRYEQWRSGVRVEHSELRVHCNEHGLVAGLNGSWCASGSVQSALITADEAIAAGYRAIEAPPFETNTKSGERSEKHPVADLVYARINIDDTDENAREKLCFRMLLESASPYGVFGIYVDARTAEVLRVVNAIRNCNDGPALTLFNGTRTIKTQWRAFPHFNYRLIDECRGDGIETRKDGGQIITDQENQWSLYEERPMTSAHWAAEMVYDYWWNVHQRSSWDANGGLIRINARENAVCNSAYTACWNPADETINCGTGGGDLIQFAFVTMEAIGHEFTHAISGLECGWSNFVSMETQSLDEAFADVFGTMVDFQVEGAAGNYLIAEDNGVPGGFARDMANPNAGSQPDTYQGTFWSYSSDAGLASYTNMGVANYWYYLLAEGGSGVNDIGETFAVNGIGKYAASRILYRAMYAYLTSTSQFADAKNATIYSAVDLYGNCSNEVLQTINAWNAVGVSSNTGFASSGPVNCASLNTAHNALQVYTARYINDMTANCVIVPNSTMVSFSAGESITLQPGFTSGDEFVATIDPCFAVAKAMDAGVGAKAVNSEAPQRLLAAQAPERAEIERELIVAPNPTTGMVRVALVGFDNGIGMFLRLVDVQGREVHSARVVATSVSDLDLSSVPSGAYVLQVICEDGAYTKRLLIER